MTTIGTGTGATGLPPIPAYLIASKDEEKLAAKFAQTNPQAKADIDYFESKAPTLDTADALMKDYRALGILLGAYGMSDQIQYPALIRKLITEDPTSTSSTAQRIGNTNYLAFAKAMAQYASNPFATGDGVQAVTDAYTLNSFEKDQGTQIPGMEQALAFKRQASGITTIAQLMSNLPALKVAVVQTGLDWTSYGAMDYDRQVKLLTSTIDIDDLQDPAKVDRMAEQFLIKAADDPTKCGAKDKEKYSLASLLASATTTDPILSILGGKTGSSSSGSDPMLALFA
ncbi:Flagellar basal-body rod protein flgF [Rhodovastum atsumiense]|nr:DUF1217 domain-containing protein [Rhodovastum atsumiense]CAH2600376.1 Flagellar basal-body rod protein flgF [Rhodovastum atsumiense]